MQDHPAVIIIGAGPSGLATAACLLRHSIPYIILEREDRFASLWTKYSYDSIRINLPKTFSSLPHMSIPASLPYYMPKNLFVQYLESYVSHFNITPRYRRSVEQAGYDEGNRKWVVKAKNLVSGEIEEFSARFLVVASGVMSNPYVPKIEGLHSFNGRLLHSTQFKNGNGYGDRNVLVVGFGDSGMDVALDLVNHGAKTSIVVRSPIHIISRKMRYLTLMMLKYFPVSLVDSLLLVLSKVVYGNLSKYGIRRPKESPLFAGAGYRKFVIMDVGAISKIKSGEIQVLPAISSISGNEVKFVNGKSNHFDAIVFCTGFRRSTTKWLKGCDYLLDDDGFPKQKFPNHWKGRDGLYCAGLSSKGLIGSRVDSQNIADDIKALL